MTRCKFSLNVNRCLHHLYLENRLHILQRRRYNCLLNKCRLQSTRDSFINDWTGCKVPETRSLMIGYCLHIYSVLSNILKGFLKYSIRLFVIESDWRNITLLSSNITSHMGFRLTYLDLTLTHSEGQGQDRAHSDGEYL